MALQSELFRGDPKVEAAAASDPAHIVPGATGPHVGKIQLALIQLDGAAITQDSVYGPSTAAAVSAFKQKRQILNFQGKIDDIVGKKTIAALDTEMLAKEGGGRGSLRLGFAVEDPALPAVRDITKQVFDALGLAFSPDANNLVPITMPTASTFKVIDETRFTFGRKDPMQFRSASNNVGRIGIFAARKGTSERAVILVVPKESVPDAVLVVISAGFFQNRDFFSAIGGGDPLSPKVILFLLNAHLKDNHQWAAQMLASSKNMAMVYIVRSLAREGSELGPFAIDGVFFRDCLRQIMALTNGSFTFGSVTAMTFSIGITDFNPFVGAISKQVNVTRVINLDPQRAAHAVRPKGASVLEFLSGEVGVAPGFELIPEPRWVNEDLFTAKKTSGALRPGNRKGRLAYFHDRCIPNYLLRLALEKS